MSSRRGIMYRNTRETKVFVNWILYCVLQNLHITLLKWSCVTDQAFRFRFLKMKLPAQCAVIYIVRSALDHVTINHFLILCLQFFRACFNLPFPHKVYLGGSMHQWVVDLSPLRVQSQAGPYRCCEGWSGREIYFSSSTLLFFSALFD